MSKMSPNQFTSMPKEKLSSYELLRLKNVEDNRKLMRSLGLLKDTDELDTNSSRPKAKRRYRKSPVPPTRRKSLRIQDQRKWSILDKEASDYYEWYLPKEGKTFKKHRQDNFVNINENETESLKPQIKRKWNIQLHLDADTKQQNRRSLDKEITNNRKESLYLCSYKRRVVRPSRCYCCDPSN